MKRVALIRKTPLRYKAHGRAPLGAYPLARTRMKRRPTRAKAGVELKYRAFVRKLPCAVCGRGTRSQFCHERRKGTGLALKSPDARGWPGCEEHHTVAWVTRKTVPLRAAYLRLYGSEPELRQSIAKGRAA